MKYHFLFERTKTEIETFPNKTALSDTNVKKIEWGVQNGPITKNRVLPVTNSFSLFLKMLFRLISCTNYPVSVFISAGVLFECASSL